MLQLFCTLYTVIHNKGNAVNTGYISYPGIGVSKSRSNSLGLRKYLGCLKHVLKDETAVKALLDHIFIII